MLNDQRIKTQAPNKLEPFRPVDDEAFVEDDPEQLSESCMEAN
jgi:hypothetical protein